MAGPLTSSPQAGENEDRLLALDEGGFVVWENPPGWAEGRLLAEVLLGPSSHAQPEATELGASIHKVIRGEAPRAAATVAGSVVTVAPPPPGVDPKVRALVLVRPAPPPPSGPPRAVPSVDHLTGLGDRAALAARLATPLDQPDRASIAVLYVDVDRFKQINDNLGHGAGDRVLATVADRLRNAVRPGDLVTRVGGDEFVIVAGGVADDASAMEIAERIRVNVAAPMQAGSRPIDAAVSIGVAVGPASSGSDLLERADAALYRAKESGRNRCELYLPAASDQAPPVGPEDQLRAALDGGLIVVYLPIVGLVSGQVTHIEAGFRLQGEGGELRSADEVLRRAERSGLMVSLGAGLLDLACRHLEAWSARPGPALVWPIGPRQLDEPRTAEQVLATLAAHGIEPARLALQLTEPGLSSPSEPARMNIDRLHREGVGLAFGDFGTGSASLTVLLDFPVDLIKLDAAFMSGFGVDPHRTKVTASVLALAQKLGIQSVAQGVREARQLEILGEMGCDAAAGPYVGGPVRAEELTRARPGRRHRN